MSTRSERPGAERPGTEKIEEKARNARDRVEARAKEATAETRQAAESLIEEGKEKVREAGEEARKRATSRAETQKTRVARGIRSVADALRAGTRDLPEERRGYAGFLEDAADRVERASDYLEGRPVEGLTADARRFARDHTSLFLGGAFALGLAGARFLKSSGSDGHERDLPDRRRSERLVVASRYARVAPAGERERLEREREELGHV